MSERRALVSRDAPEIRDRARSSFQAYSKPSWPVCSSGIIISRLRIESYMFCYIAIRKYGVITKIESHQILGRKIFSIIDTSEIPPIFFNGHSFLRPNKSFASKNNENRAHSYLRIVKVSVEHNN